MPPSLASQVVNRCLRITAKDDVTISVSKHAIPLAEEFAVECFRNGADVLMNLWTDRYQSGYLNLLPVKALKRPSVFCRALSETSTAEIFLLAAHDPSIFKKVPSEKFLADGEGENEAHLPVMRDRKVRTLSVNLAFLTEPRAKAYGFNFAKWKRNTAAAANVDYGKLAVLGKKLRSVLSGARTIRVTAPGGTDLSLDVNGRKWKVSDGVVDDEDVAAGNLNDSLPAGNLSVCPVEDGAQGVIRFNVPTPIQGRLVRNFGWRFKDGRVTEFEGDRSAKKIREQWKGATGDKDVVGSFAIGFNPKALTGYMINSLAAGAVTLAIGANLDVGGRNKSTFSFLGTLAGATVAADHRTVVKAGKLLV